MSAPVVLALAVLARPAEVPGDPLPPHVLARYGSLHYRTPGPIHGSALSPDGKLLALAGPQTVRLYEVPAWRLARELRGGAEGPGYASGPLAFSPNGKYLAHRGHNRAGTVVVVWDLTADRPAREIALKKGVVWPSLLQFTPDGRLALADDAALRFFDPATGAEVQTVAVPHVSHLSPDGKVFVRADEPKGFRSQSKPGRLVLADARTGFDVARVDRAAPDKADRLAFAPDGKTFALLSWDGWRLELRDATTGVLLAQPELDEAGAEVGFTADGAVYLFRPSGVWRWDPATGKERPGLPTGDGPPAAGLHAAPGGKTLYTPTAEGWVRVWGADGTETPVPGRYRGEVTAAPSPDGRLVAIGDASGRLDLRDAATGRLVRTVSGETGSADPWPVRAVFSTDGTRVAGHFRVADPDVVFARASGAAGRPFAFTLYRVADGAAVGGVGADQRELLGFTPAGRVILEAQGVAYTAWDPNAPAGAWALPTYNRGGRLSPDGRRIASVDGHELVLRDAQTGAEARRIALLPRDLIWWDANGVCAAAWSGDGRTVGVHLPRDMMAVVDITTGRVRKRFKADPRETGLPDPTGDPRRGHGGPVVSPDGWWVATPDWGRIVLWETATGKPAAALGPAGGGQPLDIAFHPDGRSVVLSYYGYADRADLVSYLARDPAGPPAKLWDLAGGADAVAATRAAFALLASADGRKLVREKLPPAKPDPADDERVKGWIADLGSDDFRTRERAEAELKARARRVEPAAREARRAATSPEVRRRLDVVLAAVDRGPAAAEARALRVVHAAELSDAADARDLLAAWAKGDPGATLTDEAKAALARRKRK